MDQAKETNRGMAPTTFLNWLKECEKQNDSLLCVGLDPDLGRIPEDFSSCSKPFFEFNRQIIDATKDLVSCYKPQFAHYAAIGAEGELKDTIDYCHTVGIPVILDVKRGDIGSTADKYADEAFCRYEADAVTTNPYLGMDAMKPFLDWKDKGIIVLCRTSNPGSAEIQNLVLENGKRLYEEVARKAATDWNYNGNVLLVVGATQPEEMKTIRSLTGDMGFLVPGIGAQGGDIESIMAAGQGGNLIVSSSRAILYASDGKDFAEAARKVADETRQTINRFRSD